MSIFRMSITGSKVEKITNPAKGYRHSDFSFTNDGEKMLFTEFQQNRKTALIVRDLTTNIDTQVLQSAYEGDEFFKPFIHPNGDEVIFLKNMGNDSTYVFDIFSLDIATGNVKNLTNTPEVSERMPNWSDDGKYLIFSSDKNQESFDIFKLNRNSLEVEQMSFFDDRQELNAHFTNSMLVFDSGFYGMDKEGHTFIFVADLKGKEIRQLSKLVH